MPAPPPASLLAASAEGARFLILLQVATRLLTFLVNQLVLRYIPPEMLGVSVQLELLGTSVLYFARESLRNTLQRRPASTNPSNLSGHITEGTRAGEAQIVVNLSLLTIPMGVVFAGALGKAYLSSATEDAIQQPCFQSSVGLYLAAVVLELAAEPGFAIAQQQMRYRLRACAESAAAFAKCVSICGVTIYAAQHTMLIGPLPFAVGQFAYGITLLAVYGVALWKTATANKFSVGLRAIASEAPENYVLSYFNTTLSSLAATMWFQSAMKYILTQGDTLLVTWLISSHDQGVYALASNYGSLVARMLLLPLEDTARNLFSKLMAPGTLNFHTLSVGARILTMTLKLYLLLSLFATTLGPPFAPLGLKILAGSRWSNSEAGNVLSAYCYYIPLLAINGITEAFVQSVATAAQLRRQSMWMGVFSLLFAVAGCGFVSTLGWGAQGLVAANVVNMACRIYWSGSFIAVYFGEKGVRTGWVGVLPSTMSISAAMVVATVARSTFGSENIHKEVAGLAALGAVLLTIW